ncbi:MAG: twin-arginine translocase subunit TatC [Acidobacteria bacterium]|nr:twin-arginine translocase subunit TatC [Acidobacteriota bacterium]MCB9397030.1 twin-arginine translocase subunit TatC [Acidobacteriota bacterium]
MSKPDPNQMTFFEHLEELRGRLFKSILLFLLVFALCFAFAREIFDVLAVPFYAAKNGPGSFGMIEIGEPFMARIKAAAYVAVILSSGIFFYHFWGFVAPGLSRKEKRVAIPFFFFMAFFFMAGCAFSFFQVVPNVIDFLLSWNDGGSSNITRSAYLSTLFTFVLGMGTCFEIPIVIFVLGKLGIVSPRFLMAKFKYAILIIFIIAAIITPTPDVFTQTLFAGPMIVLYLLGVGAAWLVRPKEKEEEAPQDEDEDDDEESISADEDSESEASAD